VATSVILPTSWKVRLIYMILLWHRRERFLHQRMFMVFWVMTMCSTVNGHQRFGAKYGFHFQGRTSTILLKLKVFTIKGLSLYNKQMVFYIWHIFSTYSDHPKLSLNLRPLTLCASDWGSKVALIFIHFGGITLQIRTFLNWKQWPEITVKMWSENLHISVLSSEK
jgi:hypothetical protein